MPAALAYFDSSVLVKLYLDESAFGYARRLARKYRVVSSAIGPAEVISSLRRRFAAGQVTGAQFATLLASVQEDRANWELVDLDARVIERAEKVILSALVRTLDALHIASAILFRQRSGIRVPFVTGDVRQREAARPHLDVIWVGAADA